MPELIAVQPLKYPRPIAVGEKFTVDERAARVLKMAGKARDAAGYATRKMDSELAAVGERGPEILDLSRGSGEAQPPERQRRRYQRRDMLAQD